VPFWDADDLQDGVNEALRVWAMLTGAWRKTVVVPTVPQDPVVPIPGTITYATRISWRGYQLEPTTLRDLDFGRVRWQTENTASGGRVPRKVTCWAPMGLSLVAIWPSDATGGDPLEVSGVVALDEVGVGDSIDIGEEDLHVLAGFVLHICAFKEGGSRWQGTQTFRQEMMRAAAKRNDRLLRSKWFRRSMGLDRRHRAVAAGMEIAGGISGN
jgi:hypothetical protein